MILFAIIYILLYTIRILKILLYPFVFFNTIKKDDDSRPDLLTAGFITFKIEGFETEPETEPETQMENFRRMVLDSINTAQDTMQEYDFLDYSYTIKNKTLGTFHRDVTSSQYILRTARPVYTAILYKSSGKLLTVYPKSHISFFHDKPVDIYGDDAAATVVLFNCDLIHAGCNTEGRDLIQYKICHRADIAKLSHLNGIHVEVGANAPTADISSLADVRELSYYMTLFDTIMHPLLQKKYDGVIGYLQSLVAINFYNNIN